jgi:geranylgeranyl diphosphate synthase type I
VKIYDTGLGGMSQAKDLIDHDLERFIAEWRQTYDNGSQVAIDAYCQIVLRGGKRLRGILTMQSYYAHGGTNPVVALGVARVLELVHAYLLILDDIADRSDTRRGGPSAHRLLESVATTAGMRADVAHYSTAQAVNAAQGGLHKAAQELSQLPVTDAVLRNALASFHKNIEITGMGQMNDMYNEATAEALDEAAIERVLTQKSAYYTFVNPLELGARLAGKMLLDESLHGYALHLGCAFQIADDLIGTFGDDAQTGKSTNDDIREGKMTLIAQHALANTNGRSHMTLRAILGNPVASDAECDDARRIMAVAGAQTYAIERRDWYAARAHAALEAGASLDPLFVAFLDALIYHVTSRQV